MKIIKGIFCSFLAIIFSLVLLITCVLGILNKTISRESIMKNVEKVNIYGEIKESIEEISKDYVSENTEEIFKQFVSEENVKIIIDEIADSLYEDKKVNFSKEFLLDKLDKNINEIVKKSKIELSEDDKSKIDDFIDSMYIEDSDNNAISDKPSTTISVCLYLADISNKAFIAMLSICICLAIGILVLNFKTIFAGVDFLASGLIITGIALNAFRILFEEGIDAKLWIDNGVRSNAIVNFIINILRDITYAFGKLSLIMLVSGLIAVVISFIIKYLQKTKKPIQQL